MKIDTFEIPTAKLLIQLYDEEGVKINEEQNKKIVRLSKVPLNESGLTPLRPLSVSLASPKESYWDQFKEMPDTPLKEQIQDVLLLHQLKKSGSVQDKILPFCFSLIKNNPARLHRHSGDIHKILSNSHKRSSVMLNHEMLNEALENNSYLTISELRTTLGKLIYLINHDMDKINHLLENKTQEEQINEIEIQFEYELNKIQKNLIKFKQKHKNGLLQDSKKAMSVRLAVELAKALISDSGFMNMGIIEPLMVHFLTPKRKYTYEKNIAYTLNFLKRSTLLRQKIQLIPSPFLQNSPSNDLIRITLGLRSNCLTTAVDAKKTALAALLSHMRQSPASSCFASYLAIEMLSKKPDKCLNDFCELLHKNKICRIVDGEEKEFSFLMRTGKESTSQKIKLDREGKIYGDNSVACYIWKAPGIKSACKSIGIENPKKTLLSISADLNDIPQTEFSLISISKILKILSLKAKGDFLYNFNCAKLSFESHLHNPLLRIWENVIASMAEGCAHSKITEQLLHAITLSIGKMCGNDLIFKRNFLKRIQLHLVKTIHYAYDTDMKAQKISLDGRSERGAFILYNRSNSMNPSDFEIIQNSEDFKKLILLVLRKSFIGLQEKETVLKELKDYINSDKFIVECLQFYHIENSGLSENELLDEIKTIPHTPWCDKTGNNSHEVLRIYSDRVNYEPWLTLTPKNPRKLFMQLIELGRKLNEKHRQHFLENPQTRSPLIIKSVHACSMMFADKSFMRAIDSKLNPSLWILENMINPCKSISETKITQEEKDKLLFLVSSQIILKDDLNKFRDKIASLPADLTLSTFRNDIILIIKEIHNSNYNIKTISKTIDFFIFNSLLSKKKQSIIKSSIIHFADTNWNVGIHDVHFCFIYNPGSASVEMWEVHENGKGLYPVCQEDWIIKQTWHIYSP